MVIAGPVDGTDVAGLVATVLPSAPPAVPEEPPHATAATTASGTRARSRVRAFVMANTVPLLRRGRQRRTACPWPDQDSAQMYVVVSRGRARGGPWRGDSQSPEGGRVQGSNVRRRDGLRIHRSDSYVHSPAASYGWHVVPSGPGEWDQCLCGVQRVLPIIDVMESVPVRQPPAIVEGLRKNYGRLCAVDGVSFQVRRGEIYGLFGPNGAGKTTTVRSSRATQAHLGVSAGARIRPRSPWAPLAVAQRRRLRFPDRAGGSAHGGGVGIPPRDSGHCPSAARCTCLEQAASRSIAGRLRGRRDQREPLR